MAFIAPFAQKKNATFMRFLFESLFRVLCPARCQCTSRSITTTVSRIYLSHLTSPCVWVASHEFVVGKPGLCIWKQTAMAPHSKMALMVEQVTIQPSLQISRLSTKETTSLLKILLHLLLATLGSRLSGAVAAFVLLVLFPRGTEADSSP